MKYYIPAPRLTDYRVGLIPPELIYAMWSGCTPIIVKHQVIERLIGPLVSVQATSLLELDEMLHQAADGTLKVAVDSKIATFVTPVNELASKILSAHKAWKQ